MPLVNVTMARGRSPEQKGAMLLAIAGPLLGIQVPPLVIVGMVAFSGAFSILSLPKLVGGPKTEQRDGTHA
mgnify:CR=1 FL=1